jgi:hypothetical protein
MIAIESNNGVMLLNVSPKAGDTFLNDQKEGIFNKGTWPRK